MSSKALLQTQTAGQHPLADWSSRQVHAQVLVHRVCRIISAAVRSVLGRPSAGGLADGWLFPPFFSRVPAGACFLGSAPTHA